MSTPIDSYNPNLEEEDAQIELCDYVFQIADYREDGEFHPYRFWYRYCTGAIDYPFTKERFLKNDDIIATLEGFGLDVEKFWLAVVFIVSIGQSASFTTACRLKPRSILCRRYANISGMGISWLYPFG